ncbi:uncharacterized protein LOC122501800 isoform X1 [Leptopilina heterotoma]|uniref:uncharacterized protein LOC122501800 isoform X1 n=1 Tax=Leptopilina heterotoma TaxID=63436 RepID=UPI001CA8AB62|nr:uncharacterized protein LOC122501800 isoform X1 [Leptopilina heterotoma]
MEERWLLIALRFSKQFSRVRRKKGWRGRCWLDEWYKRIEMIHYAISVARRQMRATRSDNRAILTRAHPKSIKDVSIGIEPQCFIRKGHVNVEEQFSAASQPREPWDQRLAGPRHRLRNQRKRVPDERCFPANAQSRPQHGEGGDHLRENELPVAIPCRPAKTFTVYVLDVPEEVPEDDIRHALYKYRSIVEVTRLPLHTGTVLKAINDKLRGDALNFNEPATIYTGPPVIRVTLASVEETSLLLSRGLDFYGATYFPTETPHPAAHTLAKYKNNRWTELASLGAGQRVRDLLPVFDNAGFNKLGPPASRIIKPQRN